jgi:hypothetical protein
MPRRVGSPKASVMADTVDVNDTVLVEDTVLLEDTVFVEDTPVFYLSA